MEVVSLLYQYIHMVSAAGPLQWVHDEIAQLAKLDYG
jgi:hypothetical protein